MVPGDGNSYIVPLTQSGRNRKQAQPEPEPATKPDTSTDTAKPARDSISELEPKVSGNGEDKRWLIADIYELNLGFGPMKKPVIGITIQNC